MSDIFREVEEDVRRRRLEQFWKYYGNYVIALVVLVLLGVGGWQLWLRHEAQERDKDSIAFVAAQRITTPREAEACFADLAKTATGGYGLLAKLSKPTRYGWRPNGCCHRPLQTDPPSPTVARSAPWRAFVLGADRQRLARKRGRIAGAPRQSVQCLAPNGARGSGFADYRAPPASSNLRLNSRRWQTTSQHQMRYAAALTLWRRFWLAGAVISAPCHLRVLPPPPNRRPKNDQAYFHPARGYGGPAGSSDALLSGCHHYGRCG